jgi:hypothetical protein
MTVGPVGGGGGQVADVGGTGEAEATPPAAGSPAPDDSNAAALPQRSAAAMGGEDMHSSMLASQLSTGTGGAGSVGGTTAPANTAPPTTLTQEQWDQRAQRAATAAITGGEDWKAGVRQAVQNGVSPLHDAFHDDGNFSVDLPRSQLEQWATRLNQQFSHGPNALPVHAAVEGDPPAIHFHNLQSRDQNMSF